MNAKKNYASPLFECVALQTKDVITFSLIAYDIQDWSLSASPSMEESN